jgi:diguanylate cyclase (GGDEF)-like protein/PAS domain S-box-containing protein
LDDMSDQHERDRFSGETASWLPGTRLEGLSERAALLREKVSGDAFDAEAMYRALIEHLDAVVYLDPVDGDASSLYVSPQVHDLLGISQEEWLTDPYSWSRHVHPDDLDRVWDEYAQALEADVPLDREYRMLHEDGSVRYVVEQTYPIRDTDGTAYMVQGLIFDVTHRKSQEELAFLAYHDRLTGLANRQLFEEMLGVTLSRAKRTNSSVAVLFVDLDHFKSVNDTMGHHAGDLLLQEIATRLRPCTRDADLLCRRSGDEFLVFLSDLDPVHDHAVVQAELVAERMIATFDESFLLDGATYRGSASIGLSLYPHDAHDVSSLLKHADEAMYAVKHRQRGTHALWSGGRGESATEPSMTARIRRAVDEEDWVLHWQPIVELATGRPVAAEGLIRWRDLSGGLVQPGDFLPLAEEMGLIEAIGDWVVQELCRQRVAWAAEGIDLRLSVNLSPRQLWSAHLADKVLGHLREAGVDPRDVILEVGEPVAMADPERAQKVMHELQAWGLGLAIDDFGVAQSSLARLRTMPADVLKIDRSFVHGVHEDPWQQGVVRAAVGLADHLGVTPAAIGVESEAEATFLREAGVELAQGFHFGRPACASDLAEAMAAWSLSAEPAAG